MSILSKNKLAIIVIALLAVSLLFASVTFAPVRGPEPTNADLMDQLGDIAVNVWSLRYINWEDSDGDDIHNFLEPIYNMLNHTDYGLEEIKDEIIDILGYMEDASKLMGNVSDYDSNYDNFAHMLWANNDNLTDIIDLLEHGTYGLEEIKMEIIDILDNVTDSTHGLAALLAKVNDIEDRLNGTEWNDTVVIGTSLANYTIYTYVVPGLEGPKKVSCMLFVPDPTVEQSAGEFESGDQLRLHLQIMKNGVWYNRTSSCDSWSDTSRNGMFVMPSSWDQVPVAEGIRFIIEREGNSGDPDEVPYVVIIEDS
jgi:archaellum component FlaC